jgi:hypothetical protein
MDTLSGRRLDQQGIEDYPEAAGEIYQEIARRLGVLGLDNADGVFAASTQDAFSHQIFPNKQAFKHRKNPHGHNSL